MAIYLARGETLRMTITATGETLDGTWDVGCYAKPKCGTAISLNPVIAAGVATVDYDTINMLEPSYQIDIRFTETGSSDIWSEPFTLYLSNTATPATTR